jgi:hypothetical protein
MVTLAQSSPSCRSASALQSKTATVMLAKANELVADGYNAVTIQDENGFLYLESDFALLGQKPTTEQ